MGSETGRKQDVGEDGLGMVECRPKPIVFWLGIVLLAFAFGLQFVLLAPQSAGKPADTVLIPLALFELSFVASGALYALLHAFRTRVLADGEGIRWRGIEHGWRSANWADVSDYYTAPRQFTANGIGSVDAPTIITASGAIRLTADCTRLNDLRRIVQARATSARASEWLPLGARRVDEWPRAFRYWKLGTARQLAFDLAAYLGFLALVGFWFSHVYNWFAGQDILGEMARIRYSLLGGFAVLLLPLVLIAVRYGMLYRRRGICITATPETVRYEDAASGELLDVPWGDVSDYFYKQRTRDWEGGLFTLVLLGADEKQISWTKDIDGAKLLSAIILAYAPKQGGTRDPTEKWRVRGEFEKTDGSDPATWQGGAVGMGGRVFAQSRLMAAFLSFMTLFVTFLVVMCVAEWLHPGVKDERWFPLGMTSLFALLTLWGWVCFLRTRVETDDMGITHHTPFGKKYLP